MAVHPSPDELTDFLLGKLPLEKCDEVASHLEVCPPCQETIGRLESKSDTLLESVRDPVQVAPLDSACQRAMQKAMTFVGGTADAPSITESVASKSGEHDTQQGKAAMAKPDNSMPDFSVSAVSNDAPRIPTTAELVANLKGANLLTDDDWNTIQPDIAAATDGMVLIKRLIERGTLTKFQAQLVYQGKTRGLAFGEYIVLDRIGAGGMGQVFKARHRRMDRLVALKVMASAAMKDQEAVKRFQREAKAAARLIHPNIVTAFDAGENGGVHFLVMEFVDGHDLSGYIKEHGPLPVPQAVDAILQAARGLAFAHAEGVVHRDIKPANLLRDKKGVVRVLDMGLARFDDPLGNGQDDGLTSSGAVMGTVDYMAPEQAFNTRDAGPAADVYSLGCTLYRLLTGQSLYNGETVVQKILAHREQAIPSLSSGSQTIPAALEKLYERMVAKKLADRPTMVEIVQELERIARGELSAKIVIDTQKAATPGRTAAVRSASAGRGGNRPPVKWLAAAAGAAAILFFGVWVIIRDKDGNEVARFKAPEGATVTMQSEVATPEKPTIASIPPTMPSSVTPITPKSSSVPADAPSGAPIDLLKDLAPYEHINGTWTLDRGALHAQLTGRWQSSFMPLPVTLPREYDLHAVVERMEGNGDVQFGLISGKAQFIVFLNSTDPRGPVIIGPTSATPFVRLQRTRVLTNNVRSSFVIRVRTDSVEVRRDNEAIARYSGPIDELSPIGSPDAAMTDAFIRVYQRTKFHALSVRPAVKSTSDQPSIPSSVPQPPNSATAASALTTVDVAFIGDLFIHRWTSTGSAAWQKHFARWNVVNNGQPARSMNALDQDVARLRREKINPRVLVIHAQGNGLNTANVPEIAAQFRSQLADAATALPQTKLILTSVINRGQPSRQLNIALKNLADDQRIFYFELNDSLIDSTGKWLPTMTDGSSLTAAGYELWAELLEPVLAKLLSSPSAPVIASSPSPVQGEGVKAIGPPPPLAVAPFNADQAKAHQEAWAKHLGTTVETTNSVGAKMILIPPGEFLMGSTDEQVEAALKVALEAGADKAMRDRIENDERPQHRIIITKPFLMGATEVTVSQFKKFSATGYQTEAEKAATKDARVDTYFNPGYAVTEDSPAAVITWNDAVAYCNWLSAKEKLDPSYQQGENTWLELPGKNGYRLPTEAEWEYACRAGTTTHFSFGDDESRLQEYAWTDRNSGGKSHPVGTRLPNPFGLYDMHGSLWEWCQDFYGEKWYTASPQNDPTGPSAGSSRMIRGGHWNHFATYCRSTYRHLISPSNRNNATGFRVVRVLGLRPVARIAKPVTNFNDPGFQQWVSDVAVMPADDQVKAVSQKLVVLNPGFDGVVMPSIENGVVTELRFLTDRVNDIRPVRALAGLRYLACDGSAKDAGKLSDLSPLKGMSLTALSCGYNQLFDLSPLQGMALTSLNIGASRKVSDLSPLTGMPLTYLNCVEVSASDLSPLKGMPLTQTTISGSNVSDLSPLQSCKNLTYLDTEGTNVTPASVAALQNALPNCKITWNGSVR